jgi:hypothetical protein
MKFMETVTSMILCSKEIHIASSPLRQLCTEDTDGLRKLFTNIGQRWMRDTQSPLDWQTYIILLSSQKSQYLKPLRRYLAETMSNLRECTLYTPSAD